MDEFGSDWINGVHKSWLDFQDHDLALNEAYKQYYKRYFGEAKAAEPRARKNTGDDEEEEEKHLEPEFLNKSTMQEFF